MTDETYHFTAIDARKWDFGAKIFRGYDEKRVESFRNQVADELERLSKLNQELEAKARGFHEQLRAFRERDKALNDALVSAQQLRSEIREQAERESQLILREARAEGERMVDHARGEIRRLESEITQLEKARIAYIGQLRAMVERQLAELEAAASSGTTARRPAPEPEPPSEGRATIKTPAWLESLVKE
ncbi:MAG TPA: DivIVA domain-containing protein [Candidatus Methylomirabilis sp.]|nr:DivIVA domain-containing protein [Gemmatimonadaceae bacterium]HYB41195.1 DivIVA domain-containing protein [Candidatus Methylomirabilis sp.]